MNYIELLKDTADRYKSLVCMGMDPLLEDIPEKGSPGERIRRFYEKILNEMVKKSVYPSSVKPNYAFYAQYGIEGIEALKRLIDLYGKEGIPVILDVKRGDIGKTARAYASEAYDFFGADAVTLSPYMGYDSIGPFMESYPDKGCYVLTKTSNSTSVEVQDIDYRGAPLYMYIAALLLQWHSPGLGSVVGATFPRQLSEISERFMASGKEVPLLIPGIGSQGGDLKGVVVILKRFDDARIHRINSSSGINYAYKRFPGMDYGEAAVTALRELNETINRYLEEGD